MKNMFDAWVAHASVQPVETSLDPTKLEKMSYELLPLLKWVDTEFYGLDTEVLVRALNTLQLEKKAEIIMFDDDQGVKFF